ncbi:hypothetical protein CKO11_12355 [Rhodobacter sp. TJ_12]|uniref:phage tail tube protein n=1 Tax=Rhodobacter sp. TJ_12 TaxID=2029399 RepID=UPI001CC09911|nr:phage tail tube protein [Rhodobacter sp. TJ_12]MBZ4023250.1 hypothetical protein [Rhodobacter sp. TJ_12]
MTAPVHQEYDELVLEFSDDDGTTWARNCVIMGCEVNRTSNTSTVETVSDCADESKPNAVEERVQSLKVTVSGTGNWTQAGYGKFLAKFYAGDSTTMLARIGNLGAASGEIQYEEGPIIIASLGEARTKGQVVSASITINFATTPTLTMAS